MTSEKIVRPLPRPPYVTHLEAHWIITMFGLPIYQKRKLWKPQKGNLEKMTFEKSPDPCVNDF